MGFDYAYNYKVVNPDQALKESAQKGVDCYFDNVNINLFKFTKINRNVKIEKKNIFTGGRRAQFCYYK